MARHTSGLATDAAIELRPDAIFRRLADRVGYLAGGEDPCFGRNILLPRSTRKADADKGNPYTDSQFHPGPR